MKVITVTGDNIKQVSIRVRKFFHGRDIISWFTYGGGMRPRIPRYTTKSIVGDDGGSVVTVPKYDTTRTFNGVTCRTNDHGAAIIHLSHGNGFMIYPGMKIAFMGDRIITGDNYSSAFGKPVWEYNCYQINN